jgi:hypothetical protein
MQSINHPRQESTAPNGTATTPRLRTVTGNRFPRNCSCGCGQIPFRDLRLTIRQVFDPVGQG